MKRCWFGGALLALILALGLFLSLGMGNFHRELSEEMARAAEITGSDREAAQAAADRAREKWERRRSLTAILQDHAPMEAIEENFRLLTPGAEEEDFRETCLRLAAQLEALGQAQLPTLENLF